MAPVSHTHKALSARFLLLTVSSPAFRRLLSLRGCCCISAHLSLPSLLLPLPEPLQRPCTTLHLQPSSSLLLRAARAHPGTFLHYPLALPATTHYLLPLPAPPPTRLPRSSPPSPLTSESISDIFLLFAKSIFLLHYSPLSNSPLKPTNQSTIQQECQRPCCSKYEPRSRSSKPLCFPPRVPCIRGSRLFFHLTQHPLALSHTINLRDRQHGCCRVMIGILCRTTSILPTTHLGPPMRRPTPSHAPSPRLPCPSTPRHIRIFEPG